MKVLFYMPVNIFGGAESQIGSLIKNFSGRIRPYIAYRHKDMEPLLRDFGSINYLVHSPSNLAANIRSINPDVFHCYHSPEAIQALGRLIGGRPKVYEVVHNRRGWGADSAHTSKSFTDLAVCVSPSAESYFKSVLPNFPTLIIPNGVDQAVFVPAAAKQKRERPLGGFSGRLVDGDGKGVPDLIDLIASIPEVDFELVGKDYSGIADLVRDRQIPNIKVLPHTDNIVEYYHKWDFFVSRSPAEGFGISIAEALACGLPAVVYDCGGICCYLEHGKHAFVERTDQDMKRRILEVAFGQHKLDPTSIDFSARKMAQAYEDMYDGLLSKKDEGAPRPTQQRPMRQTSQRPQIQERVQSSALSKPVRTLGVVPESWHGIRRSLSAYVGACVDPSSAAAEIRKHRPEIVVFGGYDPKWDSALVAADAVRAKKILTWHGTISLNEFDPHIKTCFEAFLARRRHFTHFGTPHYGTAKALSSLGLPVEWVPNVIYHDIKPQPKMAGFNIGIFGTGLPWKNTEVQALAAVMVEDSHIFIQNAAVKSYLPANRFSMMRHQQNPELHYADLSSMTVNLAVSMTETFSYHVMESFLAGTPAIASAATGLMKDIVASSPASRCCVVSAHDDPWEIRCAVRQVVSSDNLYKEVAQSGREAMIGVNNRNKEIYQRVIEKWGINANK